MTHLHRFDFGAHRTAQRFLVGRVGDQRAYAFQERRVGFNIHQTEQSLATADRTELDHGIDQFLRILLGRGKYEIGASEGGPDIPELERQQGCRHGATQNYHDSRQVHEMVYIAAENNRGNDESNTGNDAD